MCGIAGIISLKTPFPLGDLEMVTSLIKHRGPDDEGYTYVDINTSKIKFLVGEDSSEKTEFSRINNLLDKKVFAGISHRRFSIIDTSIHGRQPFLSNGENISVTFNGEIYNYIELRKELNHLGYGPFKTDSDTEVLVKSYEAWGVDCFKKFNGFWAIGILDGEKLILSRDRVGKKPLYFTNDFDKILFCSEIRPIINFRRKYNLPLNLNDSAVFDYLCHDRRNSNYQSMFHEIQQVDAATFIEFDTTRLKEKYKSKFWSISKINRSKNFDLNNGIEKFNNELSNSIRLRLRSDVPIEANLSGGLDSAAIVANATQILRQDNKQLTVHNISYKDNKSLDETKDASLIARHCNAHFKQIIINKTNVFEDIDNLILNSEEPVHSMAALVQNQAWHQISNEGYKVILHGSANDEIMLGYDYLKKIELLNRLRNKKYKTLFRDLMHDPVLFLKLIKWLMGDSDKVDSNLEYFSKDLMHKNRNRHIYYLSNINEINKRTGDRMMADLKYLRVPYWCNLMDKNMMRVPVEVRMPFLDHKFLEFIFSVPEKYLLRNGYTKYLLRVALNGSLPKKILWNRKKVGFSVPKKSWLHEDSYNFLEVFDYPGLEKYFNIKLVKENFTSLDPDFCWRILNFSKWYHLNKL